MSMPPFTAPHAVFAALICLTLVSARAIAENDTKVAIVNNRPISTAELDSQSGATLREMDENFERRLKDLRLTHERERHAYIDKTLNGMVDDRVIELEAAARKTTSEALLAKTHTAEPDDEQVRQFYVTNQKRIGQPFAAVSPQIKQFLQKQADQQARRHYLDSLRTKYSAVMILEPFREDVAASGPSRGPASAPVTIVEFADFQCPFCGQYAPVLHELLAKYPAQVRLVYRHLPLGKLHPNAEIAAEASVCAQDQGKFWEMYDLMFAEQDTLGHDALKDKAQRLGLDMARFDECLDSGKSKAVIEADVRAASQLAIEGTPASFINGRYVNGTFTIEQLSQIIDEELRRAVLTARR